MYGDLAGSRGSDARVPQQAGDAACLHAARHAGANTRRRDHLLHRRAVQHPNLPWSTNGTEHVALQWATQLQWQPPPPGPELIPTIGQVGLNGRMLVPTLVDMCSGVRKVFAAQNRRLTLFYSETRD